MKKQFGAMALISVLSIALISGCNANNNFDTTKPDSLQTNIVAPSIVTTQTSPIGVIVTTTVTQTTSTENGNLIEVTPMTVWGWGRNDQGQLHTTLVFPYFNNKPIQVPALNDVIAIASGGQHALALKSDGTVSAWGQVTDERNMSNLSEITAIAAGETHNLVLKSDGTVWAWGGNDWGQLGIPNIRTTRTYGGSTWVGVPDVTTPTVVNGLSDVIAISAGYSHNLVLKSDSTVWAWGDNEYGQLGNGTNKGNYSPIKVEDLNGVLAVAAGRYISLALKADGTVWAWGLWDWSFGGGTIVKNIVPVQVNGLNGVVAIAAGSCCTALKSDGTVWTWGPEEVDPENNVPVQVNNLNGVVAIAAGTFRMALKSDGTVWTWGSSNNYGQLGNGENTGSITPVQVSGLGGIIAISQGDEFGLALAGDSPAITVTPPRPPVIVNAPTTSRTETSAHVNTNVISLGTASMVYVDLAWGHEPNKLIYLTVGKTITAIGTVTFELGSLQPGTTYYYQFRAVGDGSCRAEQGSFTTLTLSDG